MTHCKLSILLATVLCTPLAALSESTAPCAALAGLNFDGVEITEAVGNLDPDDPLIDCSNCVKGCCSWASCAMTHARNHEQPKRYRGIRTQ